MTKDEIMEHLHKELPAEIHGIEEYMNLAEEAWENGDHNTAEMLMQIAGDEHDHAKFILHKLELNGSPVAAEKEKLHHLKEKIIEHYT